MSGDRWGDTARDRAEFDRWLTTDPREADDEPIEVECMCGDCLPDDAEACDDLEGWPRV